MSTYHNPKPVDEPDIAFTYVTPPSGPDVHAPIGYALAEYKGYRIRRDPEHFLWEVYNTDGTPIPEKLQSKFSNTRLIMQTIDKYIIEAQQRKLKEKMQNEKNSQRKLHGR
jgi:hypothetical protein